MPKDFIMKPEDHLVARNWREFFRSLPDDACDMSFRVRNPQDLMALRVTASQLKEERKYKVAVDFAKSTITVSVTKKNQDQDDAN